MINFNKKDNSETRVVRLKIKDNKFRVVGFGRWTDYGDAWLCAHDILHHRPEDSGRIEEEVRTFGVQYWMESKSLDSADFSSLSSTMLDFWDALKSPSFSDFIFPEPPLLDGVGVPGFKGVKKLATASVTSEFELIKKGLLNYRQYKDKPIELSQLSFLDEGNQARCVGWILNGYVDGIRRYPSPRDASLFFKKIMKKLNNIAVSGKKNTELIFKSSMA